MVENGMPAITHIRLTLRRRQHSRKLGTERRDTRLHLLVLLVLARLGLQQLGPYSAHANGPPETVPGRMHRRRRRNRFPEGKSGGTNKYPPF
jgi:hypothetical protein